VSYWQANHMRAGRFVRAVLFGAVKVAILAGVAYLACMVALKTSEATLPSAKELCDRVRSGMTVGQIETATSSHVWRSACCCLHK
jgi:hypothetical protein